MIKYEHLVGLPYKHGEQDCYSILCRFYAENFGIVLTNYARPENWWNHGMTLYLDNALSEGFEVCNVNPMDWRVGDVFGISINAPTVHHIAIYVGENKILHHFTHRLSEVVPYRHLWRKHTVGVWRHREVAKNPPKEHEIQLADYLAPAVRQELKL